MALKGKTEFVTGFVTGVCYNAVSKKEEVSLLKQERLWGNEYRTTMICLDSYEDDQMRGRFYNPALPEGKAFSSLSQLLIGMEDMLDSMKLPQAFSAVRSFAPLPEREGAAPSAQIQTGEMATFAVRILFRQNASWQGSVTWLEGGQEQSFRSVLELIFLMDSALRSSK